MELTAAPHKLEQSYFSNANALSNALTTFASEQVNEYVLSGFIFESRDLAYSVLSSLLARARSSGRVAFVSGIC